MRHVPARLSPEVTRLLRNADQRLRATHGIGTLYPTTLDCARSLAQVDSFYIGLYTDNEMLALVYLVDLGQVLSPDVVPIRPGSIPAWIRAGGSGYRYGHDQGASFRPVINFGDVTADSADVMFAPIRSADSAAPLGVLCALSYQADAFAEDDLLAFTVLARIFGRDYRRTHPLPAADDPLYRAYPELLPDDPRAVMLEAASRVAQAMNLCSALIAKGAPAATSAGLREVVEVCAEASQLLLTGSVDQPAVPVSAAAGVRLTTREAEVAELIVREGASNSTIASRLTISEKTVKAHVGSILRKCGVTQRSGIAPVLQGLTTQDPSISA
ncbi:helix-turn-helix transcriptional regulator [Nakamurella aerolata]